MRRRIRHASIGVACLVMAACGGSSTPTQPPATPPVTTPPLNALPSLSSITVQGRRPKQPPRFADAREVIDVSVAVSDAETPVDELTYEWTAPVGTFSGTGRNVTWTAPAAVSSPTDVTITLKVVEQYGHPGQPKNFTQNVSSTQTLSLHDSVKEVGDYSRQFLFDFSDTSIKNVNSIMRNFGAGSRCPEPAEVTSERDEVENNFTNYDIKASEVGQPSTTVDFGGFCPLFNRPGDACSVVRVMWDSVDKRTGKRGVTSGDDVISAAYSGQESRWWLCSSRYREYSTIGTYRLIR